MQVGQMTGVEFFKRFVELSKKYPPHPNTNVVTAGSATAQKFGFSQVSSSGMAMSNSFATSNANSKTVRTNTSENTSNSGHAIGNATFKGTVNAFAAANGGWTQ
jgi:hypothetical protein